MMNEPLPMDEMLVRAAQEFPDEAERTFFLDWACREDLALRQRIEALLDLQQNSEDFFDFRPFSLHENEAAPLPENPKGDGEIGLRIGRYRLIRRLGEGGCGVVYQAEQEVPVKRQVALKLIRMGLDHQQLIARFEMERQALAMMDHPSIARVLDAGATPTGRPYFVMEWVTGLPVTDFSERHRLTIPQRLDLFVRICHAIQHAHLKGIIHRDIKPSNVLASFHDAVAIPKVIDFGIAKIDAAPTPLADDEQDPVLGTPAYMSPEQRQRGTFDVDSRTDVYSLGVLLCELLVSRTPFSSPQSPTTTRPSHSAELPQRLALTPSQILADSSPESRQKIAAARSCQPAELTRAIAGDLDAIVLKCLHADRTQRYDTPNALANDIKRHLNDSIIHASPTPWRIRTRKLIRRQRWAIALSSVAFITLAAGFSTSTWLFFRESKARQEQSELRAIADRARAQEASLRIRAEAREACAQASVKLFYEQYEEADRLIGHLPIDIIPPSLEAAEAFRKLGEWHRIAGRLPLAAKRYTALAHSMSSVDLSDLHQVSSQVLPAATATCAIDDQKSYEQIRQIALSRFSVTQDTIVAEQMIKACLLRPADQATMNRVEKLVDFLETSIGPASEKSGYDDSASWHCYSLALWYHRLHDAQKTSYWCQLSLQRSESDPARVSCVKFLLAMSLHRTGQTDQAHDLLTTTAAPLISMRQSTSGRWTDDLGRWIDWTNAYLLLLEAQKEMAVSSPQSTD